MIYGSVCSGIEAATAAWHPLGWTPAWFAEIDRFPSAVLAHHYPDVPNLGDFTQIGLEHGPIDLLVGGSPCQSFSVAGKRAGLDDPRGDLTLEFLRLAGRLRPRWLVWENVPGVLSIDGGRTFGAILWVMGQLGYGVAYRILDAQYFGVPQRRRRVFVVGHLGDWRRAAAVLFERASLSGDTPPRRQAGEGAAAATGSGSGSGRQFTSHDPAVTLTARERKGALPEADLSTVIAHTLRGGGFDASEDGTGRGTPPMPVAFHPRQDPITSDIGLPVEAAGPQAVYLRGREGGATAELGGDVSPALHTAGGGGGDKPHVLADWAVRRLVPEECEALQGFPRGFTRIPYRNKPASECPDGPRYKALGNSMAVPVMRWIGERIKMVNDIA